MKLKKVILSTFFCMFIAITGLNISRIVDENTNNFDTSYSLSELIQVAVAQTETGGGSVKCFTRTITNCGFPAYNEKVTCDTTGDYKLGEECSETTCTNSSPQTKRCQQNING
ncbi:hypothetical protein [Aestuariibaculum sediminum]|uniref:Secreted protein n=1 Tax=Aestuariibaculum sediminum TaxID=2770637 RepID=A0A8J6QCT8_9FLAO|nr:hypothetical protein [Aestuariibaculum sediminum]MBD0833721.1 hypothetical protein [Aestuariibaculum sediminum]